MYLPAVPKREAPAYGVPAFAGTTKQIVPASQFAVRGNGGYTAFGNRAAFSSSGRSSPFARYDTVR